MVLERLIMKIILWFYQLGWQICVLLHSKYASGRIPDNLIEEIARCLLPDIVAYCESEEGKQEFAKWQILQQEQTSKAG